VDSKGKEAMVTSLRSYWCSTYLEELAGNMGMHPDDPDHPYQEMYASALAAFGIGRVEMEERDGKIREKFREVIRTRRAERGAAK